METHPDPADYRFDLETTLASIVSIRANIPEDAITAPLLGTERVGHGVVIRGDSLILTIGYLITEADTVWLIDHDGNAAPGHVLSHEHETGFGLVQLLRPLRTSPMPLGKSSDVKVGDTMVVAGSGGLSEAIRTTVVGKREFTGYWEYVLDEALFTAPAHQSWSGAALINESGHLCGVASLILQTQTASGETHSANMVVPIDLLPPILDDLCRYGRLNKPPRPWLGWFVQDTDRGLVVAGVYDQGPAHAAGLRTGDMILEVNGQPMTELAALFRTIWALGNAGVNVPVTFLRDGQQKNVLVQSVDRYTCLKTALIH